MVEDLRAGIVGLGRMASLIEEQSSSGLTSHAGAYRSIPGIKLVAGCDVLEEQRSLFRTRWGVSALYDSVEQMVRDEGLDILSICSPTPAHYVHGAAACNAGVRAIFCEKPLCSRLIDADSLVQHCQSRGVTLTVNHTRRWTPAFLRAREWVASDDAIGALRSVVAHYGGGVGNIGTHLFDTIRFLCGDITRVRALPPFTSESDPDLGGYMELANGAACHVVANDSRNYLLFEIDLVGTKGRIRITRNGQRLELWHSVKPNLASDYTLLSDEPLTETPENGQPIVRALEQLVHIVLQPSYQRPSCEGSDGVAAVEIACALRMSAERSGVWIELPLTERSYVLPTRSRALATS